LPMDEPTMLPVRTIVVCKKMMEVTSTEDKLLNDCASDDGEVLFIIVNTTATGCCTTATWYQLNCS
jgi:hypothetical protein